ncbi:MAG: lipoprotein insertase outer membrane protein LolB [Burkholderiales bacterium]|jgi:outer membrane lipoprotein LolB
MVQKLNSMEKSTMVKFMVTVGRLFSISLILPSLVACASFYDTQVDKPARYVRPVAIDNDFVISGRFSIKTLTKHEYGNFAWNKFATNEELEFKTPIGQTVAKISIESGAATLTTAEETYTGTDIDNMMQDKLGFTLPLNYLHYWIQGVALPNAVVAQDLADGFVQLGWKVEYLQWQDKNHPQIIQCSKGDLVIKLLIEW